MLFHTILKLYMHLMHFVCNPIPFMFHNLHRIKPPFRHINLSKVEVELIKAKAKVFKSEVKGIETTIKTRDSSLIIKKNKMEKKMEVRNSNRIKTQKVFSLHRSTWKIRSSRLSMAAQEILSRVSIWKTSRGWGYLTQWSKQKSLTFMEWSMTHWNTSITSMRLLGTKRAHANTANKSHTLFWSRKNAIQANMKNCTNHMLEWCRFKTLLRWTTKD